MALEHDLNNDDLTPEEIAEYGYACTPTSGSFYNGELGGVSSRTPLGSQDTEEYRRLDAEAAARKCEQLLQE